MPSLVARPSPFHRYARWFLAYLLFVIVFGAWVRITHSGAGCGSHWPTCNGVVLPRSPSFETLVEFSHRTTSGLLGLLAIGLVVWSFLSGQPRIVRISTVLTAALVLVEALIGAGLVLRELVADDRSVARAAVIAVHLVNTLGLTAAASLAVWWSTIHEPLPSRIPTATDRKLVLVALAGLVLACATGAITALGDTLFPPHPGHLVDHFRDGWSNTQHFLIRLRALHPMLAVVVASVVFGVTSRLATHEDPTTRRCARRFRDAVIGQVTLGILDIGLAAPGALQLAHLLVAQLVWISGVWTFASLRRA